MNDYIKEARRIVTGYFAALAPSEQLRRETAQELRQGHCWVHMPRRAAAGKDDALQFSVHGDARLS